MDRPTRNMRLIKILCSRSFCPVTAGEHRRERVFVQFRHEKARGVSPVPLARQLVMSRQCQRHHGAGRSGIASAGLYPQRGNCPTVVRPGETFLGSLPGGDAGYWLLLPIVRR